MSTKLAEALRALLQIRNRPISACDPVRLEAEAALASYEAEAKPAPAEPVEKWRDLAIKFDRQRMAALSHLRMLLAHGDIHAEAARKFLAEPPGAAPAAPAQDECGNTPYDEGPFTIAAPAPEPLTDDKIEDLWAAASIDFDDGVNIFELARSIERAHGIGIAASKGEQA